MFRFPSDSKLFLKGVLNAKCLSAGKIGLIGLQFSCAIFLRFIHHSGRPYRPHRIYSNTCIFTTRNVFEMYRNVFEMYRLKARTRIFPHCFAWSRVQNSNGFVLNAACCWLLGARVNISTRIKSTQFNWLNVNLAGDRGKCWSFLANKCKLHGFSVVSFEYCLVELMTSHPEWLWWGGKMCSTDWPHYRSKNWCKTVY